jgi:replicative DNA helicase
MRHNSPPGAYPGNHRRALSASSEMSRAAWVQRALPDGSAINDSFTRQGWLFLRETNMQTVRQVRTLREISIRLEDCERRRREAKKTLQGNWTRVLDKADDILDESECNAPRQIPHAWQHLD